MAFSSNDIDRLTGATLRGTDRDRIGSIGQVYVDEDGAPVWATVKTGLFGTSESFVPLDRAALEGDDVTVPFDKDTVKHAPRVEADGELDDTETSNLYDYYEGHASNTGLGTSDGLAIHRDTNETASIDAGLEQPGSRTDTETGTADAAAADSSSVDRSSGDRSETSKPHEGYDTSGPSTDDAMTRSEERLNVGTERVESGRARLRKHVVTEQQTVTVPVSHEEATLVREPITDANIGAATAGPDLSEEEHEVVLHGEEVVVDKDVVPVERVRLGTEQVTEQRQVTEDVSKEQIDLIEPDHNDTIQH